MIDRLQARILCRLNSSRSRLLLSTSRSLWLSVQGSDCGAQRAGSLLPLEIASYTAQRPQGETQRSLPAHLEVAATAVPKPKVVVITGPTAVGKTQVSLALAESLNGDIISADSVQVYRGLDVGSDKIPASERRGIAHHLLDILDPTEDFNAGVFYEQARAATKQILQRGKVPIVVGGTGFYLRWFIHGKPQTPASTPEGAATVSRFLEQVKEEAANKRGGAGLTEAELWEAYAQAVQDLGDLESADRLRTEVNNQYRLKRVLEILLSTGKPLSALNLDVKAPLDYDFRCFFLNRPRIQLYNRIGLRCEQMVQNGLLEEAQWLQERGLRASENCATKSIGYRQALEFLESYQASKASPSGELLVQMVKDIQAKSRNLCHQQLGWFRDEQLFHWIDATQSIASIVEELTRRIECAEHEGNSGSSGVLTREEAKELRGYIYRQQLICQPDVQAAILSKLERSHV